MPQVEFLKDTGFEQVGTIADYRGADLEERIAKGEIRLLSAEEPAPAGIPAPETVPNETPVEIPTEEPVETPITEVPAVVEGE